MIQIQVTNQKLNLFKSISLKDFFLGGSRGGGWRCFLRVFFGGWGGNYAETKDNEISF